MKQMIKYLAKVEKVLHVLAEGKRAERAYPLNAPIRIDPKYSGLQFVMDRGYNSSRSGHS